MERLERKICLDTDVVIAILNNEPRSFQIVDRIESYEAHITVITLFELLCRETSLEKIEIFKEKVNILEFNEVAAREASLILKNLKKKGRPIDFRDIFIASICIVNNCYLATFNIKHFKNIDGLKLIE